MVSNAVHAIDLHSVPLPILFGVVIGRTDVHVCWIWCLSISKQTETRLVFLVHRNRTICSLVLGQGPTDLAALKQASVPFCLLKFLKKIIFSSSSYDQAPNMIDYDFETVHNIDEWKCESALTVKEVLRYWNMSVQYWMATCVYKRIKWRAIA